MDAAAFEARVRATIVERGLFASGRIVAVAVSGGPDSMAMLHALHALRASFELDLHVAHFDHRLRPGSQDDAAYVAEAARALGVPVTLGTAEDPVKPRDRSPEEAARDARRAFLEETAAAIGAHRIATGHTMDDQAETVLMRLLQGTGRRGLGAITPRRWWHVRPLIDVRRAEAQAYCDELGLEPRHDPMNEDRRFLRNEIRAETLPFLARSINARVVEALARLADIMRDEDAALDELAAQGCPAFTDERGETRLDIDALAGLPEALQRRALRLATWVHDNVVFSAEHTERLRRLALAGSTGSELDLPEGIWARVEYRVLVLGSRPTDGLPPEAAELVVPGETDLIGWGLRVRSWVSAEPPNDWPDGRWTCVVDADRVTLPLTARASERGDRFRPLGMNGGKKVGDFFTDERVPRARRADLPLIVDGDGRIVWVVGHRIDDRARVTPGTRRHLWLAG